MIRKFMLSGAFVIVAAGLASADQFLGAMVKIEGNKVTFIRSRTSERVETTLPGAPAGVKVVKGYFVAKSLRVEPGEELPGGLTHDKFKDIDPKKGVRVQILTDADNKTITEIRVTEYGSITTKKPKDK